MSASLEESEQRLLVNQVVDEEVTYENDVA
jgi:hypothetical protein